MPTIVWPDLSFGPINLWNASAGPHSISSPCVKQCRLSNGVCVVCMRTEEEIACWEGMSNRQRLEVIRRVKG
jgi:hypothetical protein